MDTFDLANLIDNCNKMKDFRDGWPNIQEPSLVITNGNRTFDLSVAITDSIKEDIVKIVSKKIQSLEEQIKEFIAES